MLCRDCTNRTICKHYDYLYQNPHLHLGNCDYYNTVNQIEKPILSTVKLEPESIYKDPKVIPLNNSIKEYPDLRGDPNTCPNCNSKTYGDIYKCSHCNIEICDSCSLVDDVDVISGEVVYLCEECYASAHKDDVEEKVDESSIFDVLTSELEISEGEDN